MFIQGLKIAWGSLSSRKARSLLTLSTVAIGCFAIVLAASLAASGLESLKQSIEELGGARLILIEPKLAESAEKKRAQSDAEIGEDDRAALSLDLPHLETLTHYAGLDEQDITSDVGRSARADFVAADESFFELFRMRVAAGRPLNAEDTRGATQNCVVGPKVAEAVWSDSPVGHKLSIGKLHCRVVGVFADNNRWGTNFGFDWNNVVVVPFRTAALRLPNVRSNAGIALRTDSHPESEDRMRIPAPNTAAIPRVTPKAPPAVERRLDSSRNCWERLAGVAPSALRMPISGTRSETLTNIMFMMPTPPMMSAMPEKSATKSSSKAKVVSKRSITWARS